MTQCVNGRAASPWNNCNGAICDFNDCVLGHTKFGCFGNDEKGENELCGLKKNNCKDGLKCVDQEDGCDNGVGRCVKSGKV